MNKPSTRREFTLGLAAVNALTRWLFDRAGFAPSLANREFFAQAYAKLVAA